MNVLQRRFWSLKMRIVSLFQQFYLYFLVFLFLQGNFTILSLTIIYFLFSERNVKCYERRKKCYERFGWCYAADEWGFCNEINYLPDEPDDEDPLFEVPTFIWPKEVYDCKFLVKVYQNLPNLSNFSFFAQNNC